MRCCQQVGYSCSALATSSSFPVKLLMPSLACTHSSNTTCLTGRARHTSSFGYSTNSGKTHSGVTFQILITTISHNKALSQAKDSPQNTLLIKYTPYPWLITHIETTFPLSPKISQREFSYKILYILEASTRLIIY